MEQLWEKGKVVVVQGQRGAVAAAARCLSAAVCLYPSHSWRRGGLQRLRSPVTSP